MTTSGEILIGKTQEFTDKAKEVSDFIANLPISVDENNRLVLAMVEQVELAEKAAFIQGFAIGVEYAKKGDDNTENLFS